MAEAAELPSTCQEYTDQFSMLSNAMKILNDGQSAYHAVTIITKSIDGLHRTLATIKDVKLAEIFKLNSVLLKAINQFETNKH